MQLWAFGNCHYSLFFTNFFRAARRRRARNRLRKKVDLFFMLYLMKKVSIKSVKTQIKWIVYVNSFLSSPKRSKSVDFLRNGTRNIDFFKHLNPTVDAEILALKSASWKSMKHMASTIRPALLASPTYEWWECVLSVPSVLSTIRPKQLLSQERRNIDDCKMVPFGNSNESNQMRVLSWSMNEQFM